MTRDEFESAYAQRSGITVATLRALGRTVRPCTCGAENCQGWQSISEERAKEYDGLPPEQKHLV